MPNGVSTAQTPPLEWSSAGNPLGTAPTFTADANATFSGTVTHSGAVAQTGALNLGAVVTSTPATAQALSGNDGTITLPTAGFTKEITNDGNQTGVIIAAGSVDGQLLVLFNSTATNTVTMATAATSNVANGTSCVIRGLEAAMFIWDSGAARWFAIADAQ
jgi:hypothetical protein